MKDNLTEKHIPVLFEELVERIEIFNNKKNTIIDATLGMWWHAEAIITKMNPWDIFVWFDTDERNLVLAQERLSHVWKDIDKLFIHSNFENLKIELEEKGIQTCTGIYYDLGLSSLHLDEAERGFSFKNDGPLDMRLDARQQLTAALVVNKYRFEQLIDIFEKYGEEPLSKKIARAICDQRRNKPFETTSELNELIKECSNIPKSNTRIFQAIRIEVNHELRAIESSLNQAIDILEPEGNIFVISFHSLEDRITKHIFKQEARNCICTDIICSCWHKKQIKIFTKKPILPTEGEVKNNPRSRSAKARHAKKI